jgi:ketosteroid isomerase-like protein
MTFRETLEEHLRALKDRDLPALIATLPDDELTLIRSDGRIVRSVDEFIRIYRDWFSSPSWTIEPRLEELTECDSLGLAVIHLTCRDEPEDDDRVQVRDIHRDILTLAFARLEDRWVLFHNQSTPIRARSPG